MTWLQQVKDCLKQNEELRSMLDKLRTEQTSTLPFNGMETQKSLLEATKEGGNETVPQAYAAEILSLKVGLRAEDNTSPFGVYMHAVL